jgi:phage terminase large subunit-like protein
VLLGRPDDWGTGMIPKRCLIDVQRTTGVRDLADTVTVRHVTGGVSRVKFKTYDQGRLRWQAETLDWVWFDEEPSEEIYTEGLSRTNATGGMVFLTFTPLLGVSDVVMRFLKETSPDRADIVMTIEDAQHIPAEERQRIIDSYPPRMNVTPGLEAFRSFGSGRVFPFPRSMIAVEPFKVPRHWGRIGGMDIGWDHPTAAVELAHDRDANCVYVIQSYRQRQQAVSEHAGVLRLWGSWLPWAWPHDAFAHEDRERKYLSSTKTTI